MFNRTSLRYFFLTPLRAGLRGVRGGGWMFRALRPSVRAACSCYALRNAMRPLRASLCCWRVGGWSRSRLSPRRGAPLAARPPRPPSSPAGACFPVGWRGRRGRGPALFRASPLCAPILPPCRPAVPHAPRAAYGHVCNISRNFPLAEHTYVVM